MSTEIKFLSKPELKNPIFIEGLPGIGNVGRVAAGHLIAELDAKKFAELYSDNFLPFVLVYDNAEVHLLKNEFYYWKAKNKNQRDLIIMIGDGQSLGPKGHYEIAWKILEFVEKFGCKEIFTLGGLGTGRMEEETHGVYGVVSDESLKNRYKNYKINFDVSEKIGTVVGASGLLLGVGKLKGMKGMCLMGETAGFPIVTDPKAAEKILNVLTKILNIKIDMSSLEKRVKEMDRFIKKLEQIQRMAMEELAKGSAKGTKPEELRYIG